MPAAMLLGGCPTGTQARDCRDYRTTPTVHLVDGLGQTGTYYDGSNVTTEGAFAGLPSCNGFDGLDVGATFQLDIRARGWAPGFCYQYHATATTSVSTVFGPLAKDDQLRLEDPNLVFHDPVGADRAIYPGITFGGGSKFSATCTGAWFGAVSVPFPTDRTLSVDAVNASVFDQGQPSGPAPTYVVRYFRADAAENCPGLGGPVSGPITCVDVFTAYLTPP